MAVTRPYSSYQTTINTNQATYDGMTWADKTGLSGDASSTYRTSPTIDTGANFEINHHYVTVTWTGAGTVDIVLVHHISDDVDTAMADSKRISSIASVATGVQSALIAINRKTGAETRNRYGWLLVKETGTVTVTAIAHVYWSRENTIYNHEYTP